MKFVFYNAEGKYREDLLADVLVEGCAKTQDEIQIAPNNIGAMISADVAIMIGLKSIVLREACIAAGQRVLIFDKGYNRKGGWWRVAIDAHQPTRYLMSLNRSYDRAASLNWSPKKWRESRPDSPVIIAGGGRKYYDVFNLPEPVDYVSEIVDKIRIAGCKRKIWYRPKPSMSNITPVPGTVLSRHKSIYEILGDAHALITYGSNACFEAMLAGIPSIVLGDAIAGPISSSKLEDIENPFLADDQKRSSLLSNLAYCQFDNSEISTGYAINELKTQLREIIPGSSQ